MSEYLKDIVYYSDLFAGESIPDGSRRARALAIALEIRKFEIELYWKRAAYFWAFTGAALAGYLKELSKRPHNSEILLLTSSVGLVFAVAWYFVNRGSKYWQKNWETHVDLLEDAVHGPLYKTIIDDTTTSFWKLDGSYPFSVSKINQLLSLFSVVIFASFMVKTLFEYYGPELFLIVVIVFAIAVLVFVIVAPLVKPTQSQLSLIFIFSLVFTTAVLIKFHENFQCYGFPIIVTVFTISALISLWSFGESSNEERNKIKEFSGYPFTEVEIPKKPYVR
jgi:hypothetical protein